MTPRSHLFPPTVNRLRSEPGGVVVNPDTHPALVRREVIDAVGDSLAQLLVHEVVDKNLDRLPLALPFAPSVPEFPDEFLLLCVDRDHGLTACLEVHDRYIDVLELGIPVRVIGSFFGLAVT